MIIYESERAELNDEWFFLLEPSSSIRGFFPSFGDGHVHFAHRALFLLPSEAFLLLALALCAKCLESSCGWMVFALRWPSIASSLLRAWSVAPLAFAFSFISGIVIFIQILTINEVTVLVKFWWDFLAAKK